MKPVAGAWQTQEDILHGKKRIDNQVFHEEISLPFYIFFI
jgi:hypothetical protein